MGNSMKKLFAWSLIVLTVFSGLSMFVNAKGEQDAYRVYEYPVRPGSGEWRKLQGHQEMIDICQLPDEWLKTDTSTLLACVLEYPLLADIYAWTTFDDGLTHVASYFNGLKELLKRTDMILAANQFDLSLLKFEHDYDEVIAKQTLLLLQNYTESLSEPVGIQAINATEVTNGNVVTPNNTQVPHYENLAWINHGIILPVFLNSVEDAYIQQYSLTQIYTRNPSYNCHSFAWKTSYPNIYWIDNPYYFWNDGSYYQVYSAVLGYRLIYYNASEDIPYNHSAIVGSTSGSTVTVESKWGYLGAYWHAAQSCPYYISGSTILRYYTRNGE